MMRRWVFGLVLAGLAWGIAGCGNGEGGKAPAGGVAAPGSPTLPGASDAGIDVKKKTGK